MSGDYLSLSDQDSEFYIQVKKHIFEDEFSLEFLIQNNSENEIKQMKFELEFDDEEIAVLNYVSQEKIDSENNG